MGFIIKENIDLIHVKLTEEGRRKIAEGNFFPTKFALGDSETNYEYFNQLDIPAEPTPHIFNSKVLSPVDNYKEIKHYIKKDPEDTDPLYNIDSMEMVERPIIVDVEEKGFFNGSEYLHTAKPDNTYHIQKDIRVDLSTLSTDNNRVLAIRKSASYFPGSREPMIGDYVMINWTNPHISVSQFQDKDIDAAKVTPFLWYKIIGLEGSIADNTLVATVDRDLPNFGTVAVGTRYSHGVIYPKYNSMLTFYNSPFISDYWEQGVMDFTQACNNSPLDSPVWNLNIVQMKDIIGLDEKFKNLGTAPSSKYAGFNQYIRSKEKDFDNIGIIHYTNNNPDNTYGEKFNSPAVEINLPTIIWHKNKDNVIGVRFYADTELLTMEDFILDYYNLIDKWGTIVGMVFPDLKMITITDSELLYAMSYKSNRNWTLLNPIAGFNLANC